ncbi:putative alpha-1,3-mannosyltransferase MNN1 [Candida viswanathii]|uniref:Putative alpha-1,3-mannosyltransferase MNN1 n=1 Tax=Candida viswanathii TaxID=5486 RepID=A0A367YGV0_9ASCO|nr:putative alpha-1,3-mannosyltransferase MNN1 [Candida viswanathii]
MLPLFRTLRRKRGLLAFIALLLIFILNVHLAGYKSEDRKLQLISDIHNNKHDTSYIHNRFLSLYPLDVVLDVPLDQRCELFFQFLFEDNKRWMLDPLQHFVVDYSGDEYSEFVMRNAFRLSMELQEKHKVSMQSDEFGGLLDKALKDEYFKYTTESNLLKITDDLAIFRAFNKCYVKQERTSLHYQHLFNKLDRLQKRRDILRLEHRVYPWLSRTFPTYERYDGTRKELHMDPNDLVLHNYQRESSGRGIVVTIAEKHVKDIASLIHLLRALKNKLPIEIIYTSLSEASKNSIINAARDDYRKLPPQDMWLVGINAAISQGYDFIFKKFDYKILSMLFNSFQEFILIDADTVFFKNPEQFFNLKGYQRTGAFFFKDRGLLFRRPLKDAQIFSSFGPTAFDATIFGIPQMTNHTLNNPCFRGLIHFQESGVVVLDKSRHFDSILMVIQLALIRPITVKSMGDKELYWLGFSLNGDENYVFNDNFAAAIGELTPANNRVRSDGQPFVAQEICSTHPAHISSEDGSLLWMNTGFKYCEKDVSSYEDEAERNKKNTVWKHLETGDDFKKFYNDPLRITHAIIPPLDDNYMPKYNYEGEPPHGWIGHLEFCKNYMTCAYTSIGGKENRLEGQLITFSDNDVKLFEYLGKIWVELQ